MPASHFLLLVESDPERTDALAAGLVRLGVEPIRVPDLADAVAVVKSKEYAIAAIIVPADLSGGDLRKALKSMRRREPVMPAMAYGKAPVDTQADALRNAGILLALWDGYDEGLLRFQVNRLLSGDTQSAARRSRRAPAGTPVRILVGGREKGGVIYSLSEGGCFIETPRASMDGAHLVLRFEIDGCALELSGDVAFSNVPGNLQRPNLPLGMGVRFDDVPTATRQTLERFIQRRTEALEI
jgi:Tfp pilus assembly protein PilZ